MSGTGAPQAAERDTVTVEVVIAGAGPAGIATAVALARRRPDLARGGRIVCFDKARFPREKPCGGGLTGHAHAALGALGLAVRVPAISCGVGQIVYGGARRTVALERPVDVVRREDFDADLVAQARALGIVVLEEEEVTDHRVDAASGCVFVTTSRGRHLKARVLVGADGAGSRIRKELRTAGHDERQRRGWASARASARVRPLRLFKLELPAPRNFPPEMIYDFSPMDGGLRGYVWLFPVAGGRLNVGVMHTPTTRLSSGAVMNLLQATLARHGVTLPASARGWPAWRYLPRAALAGPHVLCVGDAAGIDALTGEGIAVGLEHGVLAANAMAAALSSGDFTFRGYRRAVRRATVGRELALDGHLAARLYARRGFRFWLSLVMFDRQVRELYAARVCGSEVLADRRVTLLAALGRHVLAAPFRLRRLARVAAASPLAGRLAVHPVAVEPGSAEP